MSVDWIPSTSYCRREKTLEVDGLPYKEQFRKLDLFTLSHRRLRCDLILMYRLLRNDFELIYPLFFITSEQEFSKGNVSK